MTGKKIICKECHAVLQDGTEPPELKMCLPCVRKTTPAADLNKILQPGIVDEHGDAVNNKKPEKPKELGLRIDTEFYTQEMPDNPKPIALLVFFVTDYKKNPLLEFGVDLKKVTEWYNYMKKLEENPPPGGVNENASKQPFNPED